MKLKSSYEITPLTLALIVEVLEDGSYITCVYEMDTKYYTTAPPTKIMEYACEYFGSSLKGRIEGTIKVCRIAYKVPIVVDPTSDMYFFPTASLQSKLCAWIAHSHIVNHRPINNTKACEIEFINGQKIILDVSYGQITNQILRTSQLRYALESRMKKMNNTILEIK